MLKIEAFGSFENDTIKLKGLASGWNPKLYAEDADF